MSRTIRRTAYSAAAAAALAAAPGLAVPPVIDQYISTGDNFFVGTFLPVDSPASIAASFDMLKDLYGTRRVYWRGLQESLYIQGSLPPENVVINRNLQNSIDLIQNQQINQQAVAAARARGMQIYGVGSIFDWGVAKKDPIFYGFPGDHEHYLRTENPQWIPVDKYGNRRQGGNIEMAYAEARAAMVNWYVNEVNAAGYDGMMTHSYNENFTMRFWDEFGFSDPIVNEFKNRYGVDIRKENFNRQQWYDLRGEYVTQFVSELKTALAANGKKLNMPVTAATGFIDKPTNWLQMPFSVAGNMTMDWNAWAQSQSVDELMVWGSSDIAFNTVKTTTQGTNVPTSILTSEPYFPPLQPIMNSGAPIVGAINEDKDYLLRSNLSVQPLSALNSDPNVYKRMRVLAQIIEGQTSATSADVTPSVTHPNILMKRLALRALGKLADPAAVPTIEAQLLHPEHSVRVAAMYALVESRRPESAQLILNAIAANGNAPLIEPAVQALRKMPTALSLLEQRVAISSNANERATAMRALALSESVLPSTMLPTFTAALNDSDGYVRAFAVDAVGRMTSNPTAVTTLMNTMTNADPILSNRSATALKTMLRSFDPAAAAQRANILNGMDTLFRKFGDGTTRSDFDWGWVQVGQAMADLVPDGSVKLRTAMNQRLDRATSLHAWELIHLRQKPGEFVTVTESADAFAQFKKPRWDTAFAGKDSFDLKLENSLIHNQKSEVGQTWQVAQGNVAEQIVQSVFSQSGKALKAVRRAGGAHEIRLAGDTWDAQSAEITLVTAKGSWYRDNLTDLTAFGIDIGAGIEAQISIDPNSFYRVWQTDGSANGGQYLQTGIQAGTDGWETIEIALTFNAASGTTLTGSYDVFVSRDAASSLGALSRTRIANDVPIHSIVERTLQQLIISNQSNGSLDTITFWDNLSLTVGRVLPSIAGDANLSGAVNLDDFTILAANFGTAGPWTEGDFNGDALINLDDFTLLAANFGQVASAEGARAVPEPTGLVILAAGAAVVARRRRLS